MKKLQKLKCQELAFFDSKGPKLPLPVSFDVLPFISGKNIAECIKKTILCELCINKDFNDLITLSAGIKSLISESDVPIIQVRFLSFLRKPITDCLTAYIVMLNMERLQINFIIRYSQYTVMKLCPAF